MSAEVVSHERQQKLPPGWVWTSFGEIADYINGRAFKKSEWGPTGRPIIRIQNLTGTSKLVHRFSHPVDAQYLVRDGDILLSWSATLGAYIYKGEEAVLNQHIFSVRPYVHKNFLYYLLSYYIQELKQKVHGTGMQHITKGKFQESAIPLPPLPEQHRIVAKIEELFTKLDAGVESLKRAQLLLKRYKQAVLKAAVEGKLTEKWREEHKDEIEPASELLKRILEERRRKWEAEHPGKKYKEPTSPDTDGLPELPEGWTPATISQLALKVQYGSSKKAIAGPEGIPVLRMGNILDGKLHLASLKYLPENHDEFPELLLRDGDLLFNRTNSFDLVGKSAVYHGVPSPCSFASYLIRVRFHKSISSDFLAYFINSSYGRAWIARVVSQQVGQANVNGTKLQALTVFLPPAQEQRIIVEEVERYLSVAEAAESMVNSELKRAEKLGQSILKQAFSGKLVPQDPTDEPASVLLERIKEEKAKREQEKKKRKRSKSKAQQMRLIENGE